MWTEERRARMKERYAAKANEELVDGAGALINTWRGREQQHWDRINARFYLGRPMSEGWTIGQVAKRIGRSRGFVRRLVGPVERLRQEHREYLARALGMTAAEAFPGVERLKRSKVERRGSRDGEHD